MSISSNTTGIPLGTLAPPGGAQTFLRVKWCKDQLNLILDEQGWDDLIASDTSNLLTAFLEEGCGCKWNGHKPCYTSFSREQYEVSRMQCAELSRAELDLIILGQIAGLLKDSTQTSAHRPSAQRQCTTIVLQPWGADLQGDVPKAVWHK